ncbi:XdhC family protein [Lentimonas sp. CC4]|uniref:XdhC family protein n=1 Tax=Lentimonas sp. CC4 TaxID=2676099 RepID=UPI00138A6977|nr:XdhC family protein [Lentimonas sp. CC4]
MNWTKLTSALLSAPLRSHVLISLVSKEGSSYLQPGARMLVREDGKHWGNISAGCLEEKVTDLALHCLRTGKSQLVTIDTRPHYGCFGKITLLIEVFTNATEMAELFQQISERLARRATFNIETDYSDLTRSPLTRISEATTSGNSLIETVHPVERLLIFGNWPDGQALAAMARILQWEVSIFDANAPHFSIEDTLSEQRIDSKTAAMVMTHSLASDTRCLKTVLSLNFGYIGVIGSRKRGQTLAESIADIGAYHLIEALDQIHCPSGLNIGGSGPEAIALSVLAEIQATFSARDGSALKHRSIPIHCTC